MNEDADICCLCLTESGILRDIPTDDNLNEKVLKIFGVQLVSTINETNSSAALPTPTGACDDCVLRLDDCWNFRQQVLNSFACLNIIKLAEHETPALTKTEEEEEEDDTLETLEEEYICDESYLTAQPTEIGIDDDDDMEVEMLIDKGSNQSSSSNETEVEDLEQPVQKRALLKKEKSESRVNFRNSKNNRTCETCQKVFPTLNRLKTHMTSHLDDRPFTCPECPMRFKSKRNVRNHHLAVHETNRPHVCDKCGKRFARIPDLNKHTKTIHAAKSFKCDVCHRKFIGETSMLQHRSKHLEKTLYQCEFCPESFRTQLKLSIHKEVHNDPNLDMILTKSKHRCEICCKRFISKSALGSHLITHAEERPFFCKICDLTFKVKSTLLAHEKVVHQKILPHKCQVCGKGHSRKANLTKHMLTHTDAERKSFKKQPSRKIIKCDMETIMGKEHDMKTNLVQHKYCHDCHQLFANEEAFDHHREKLHGMKEEELKIS